MVDNAKEIIDRAKSIRGIYVMGGAGPDVWDCSGFVGYCVGAPVGTRLFATPNEGAVLSAAGYRDMRGSVDLDSGAGMKPGDVLIYNKPNTDGLYNNGHTEIYYGNGVTIGARSKGQPVGI
jgi:cell wall-associated NlpC family hydrolase